MLRTSSQNAFMWPLQSLLTGKVLNYVGVPLSIDQEKKTVPKRTIFSYCCCLRFTLYILLSYLKICFFPQMIDSGKNFPFKRDLFSTQFHLSQWDQQKAWLKLPHTSPPPLYDSTIFTSHRCWSQDHSPINFQNANLHLRVCFLGNSIKEGWIQK